ncbi:MAG: hypothetical protein K9M98_00670 [Cephaloticoccus sp.]|nr:hypothetical protein [Cephaloticoccus sp.]MCF7758991.1 hypothetical protein [Cephaloticoccus sp.]
MMIVGFAVAGSVSRAQPADIFSHLRLQTSAIWADNISRTSNVATQQSSQVYNLSGTWDQMHQVNRHWLLVTQVELAAVKVAKFDALNSFTASADATFRRKFGLGPLAPTLDFRGKLSGSSLKEAGRSGWQIEGRIVAAKRLTDSIKLSALAGWEEYSARHQAYDVITHRATAEIQWDITARWQLAGGGGRIWGEFVTNAAGSVWARAVGGSFGPVVRDHYQSLAWETSNTFGPGWVAYRVRDSRADLWWVELSPALNDSTSLTFRFEAVHMVNAIGVHYESAFSSLSLNHRF